MSRNTLTLALDSLDRIDGLADELLCETLVFSTCLRAAVQRGGFGGDRMLVANVEYQAGQAALQLLLSAAIMNTQPWLSSEVARRLQEIMRGAVEGRGHRTSRALAALMVSRFDELARIAARFDTSGSSR